MIEIISLVISILSGIAVPIILIIYTNYQNKNIKVKLYIDCHELYDCFLKDMDSNLASKKGFKYDIRQIEYLILGGRTFLKPIYKYIKKCYKKNEVPDKNKINKYVEILRNNHCEIYTFNSKEVKK